MHTLNLRSEARAAEFRARGTELHERLREWARHALQEGLVRRAWLIGSLAKGTWGARSDVDVVVEGLESTRAGRVWDELSKRLGCDVDLLELERLPPDFAQRVLREGEVLG